MRSTNPLPLVGNARTRLLIAGSLPGRASLAAERYYAHRGNHFWRLTGAVIGRPLPDMPYPDRLEALLDAGIGLWDSIASAERAGSLDAAIRDPDPRPAAAIAERCPNLRALAFNGQMAARQGAHWVTGLGIPAITLPSSSGAHAIRFEARLAGWMRLHPLLAP